MAIFLFVLGSVIITIAVCAFSIWFLAKVLGGPDK
jgi:hypothetical protein